MNSETLWDAASRRADTLNPETAPLVALVVADQHNPIGRAALRLARTGPAVAALPDRDDGPLVFCAPVETLAAILADAPRDHFAAPPVQGQVRVLVAAGDVQEFGAFEIEGGK